MKKVVTLLVLLLTESFLFAQAPSIEWSRCYGGSKSDYINSLIEVPHEGYILSGYTYSNDGDFGINNSSGLCINKLDQKGIIKWQKLLDNLTRQNFSIQCTKDKGYIIAGDNDKPMCNHGASDFSIAKLKADGSVQWQKCYGGSFDEIVGSVQQTNDGGFIIAGSTSSHDGDVINNNDTSRTNAWILKLDPDGNIQWQKCFGGMSPDYIRKIIQTNDGGFIATGFTDSNDGDVIGNHGSSDILLVKLNSGGDIQWLKCLGGSQYEEGNDIQATSDGGYIIAGITCSPNDGDVTGFNGGIDFWIVKLNSEGIIQWQKCLGGSKEDDALSISETSDKGFIITGRTSSNDFDVLNNHGNIDIWIVKLDSDGSLKWQKCLGGSNDDVGIMAQQTSDGGYIITGTTKSRDGDISGYHLGVDGFNEDIWVAKLSSETSIDDQIVSLHESISITPNPSSLSVTVKTLNMAHCSDIIIYDAFGSLVCSSKTIENELNLDISSFVPGVYTAVAGKERKMFVVSK